jgi:hypothetical protein
MILEGLFGGLLGGIMRLAPEVIKFFNSKADNDHEYRMYQLQTELVKVKGEFAVEEKYVDYSVAQLDALSEAYKEQSAAVSKASKWVANASAMVRPGITYSIFLLYVMFKVSVVTLGISTGQPWIVVFGAWGMEDMAMLNMIISYWFVGRSLEKYRKQ